MILNEGTLRRFLSEKVLTLVGDEREQALTVKEEVTFLAASTRVAPRDYNSRPLYLIQGTGVFLFL